MDVLETSSAMSELLLELTVEFYPKVVTVLTSDLLRNEKLGAWGGYHYLSEAKTYP
jgi:hypothetical protein